MPVRFWLPPGRVTGSRRQGWPHEAPWQPGTSSHAFPSSFCLNTIQIWKYQKMSHQLLELTHESQKSLRTVQNEEITKQVIGKLIALIKICMHQNIWIFLLVDFFLNVNIDLNMYKYTYTQISPFSCFYTLWLYKAVLLSYTEDNSVWNTEVAHHGTVVWGNCTMYNSHKAYRSDTEK